MSNEAVSAYQVAARCEEIRPGTYRVCRLDSTEVLIFNIAGTYFAVENLCSHLGKPLAGGRFIGTQITCPFHSGAFDVRTGAHMCFPATKPIRTFPVRMTDGVVEVCVGGAIPAPCSGAGDDVLE